MTTTSNIPSPSLPMTTPDGRLSQVWFQFFVTLFSRTGGTIGQDTSAMQQLINQSRADIAWLQSQTEQGDPQADVRVLHGLIAAIEATVHQALAVASQKPDERGEAGDGATLSHLLARINDLESKIEASGASAPAPVGYDTTTINGTSRLIAYY